MIRTNIRLHPEQWLPTQVADPFWSYLKQGAEPRILARSAAIGFNIGVCPLIGDGLNQARQRLAGMSPSGSPMA